MLLGEPFKLYNNLLKLVCSAMENIPVNSGETIEEYFTRIL